MTSRRIIIAGTSSGVGKTTLSVGLMSAFIQQGRTVQGFKCGPDYIDPTYHTAVTGRPSRNLDSWMLDEQALNSVLLKGSKDADISIIEGVMGFYDGKNPLSDEGSTAHISIMTRTPVILVVNCSALARSAAAIVHGFQQFNTQVNIAGVIANQVGSQRHYELVKQAIEQTCSIPAVGYLPKNTDLTMPERQLGLVPSVERGDLTPFFEKIGQAVADTVDLNRIYDIAEAPAPEGHSYEPDRKKPVSTVKIAVAKDAAFNFYYIDNLELLEAYGAELVYFSPLAGEPVPEGVHGLYLGGGFPEIFAEELSAQEAVRTSVRQAVASGMPTVAECGGFMYLCDALETTDGVTCVMAGVLPGHVSMTEKLQAIGYREASGQEGNFLLGPADTMRGHEFHYSKFTPAGSISEAFKISQTTASGGAGVLQPNLVAGYAHFHFGSNPGAAENWINACKRWRDHV